MRWAVLALAALALAGCESTQEKSARLEVAARTRRASQREKQLALERAEQLRFEVANRVVKVRASVALHGSEGSAVVVTVVNRGSAQREVPLEFSASQHGGPPVSNTGPGLARSLSSIAYVPARSSTVWVDDQVNLTGTPGAVKAKLGEGARATGPAPHITLGATRLTQEGNGEALSGTVANASSIEQRELVVYAVASRGSRVIAAGRAVIASLAPHSSASYEVFLLGGSARGAKLAVSAPPTSFG